MYGQYNLKEVVLHRLQTVGQSPKKSLGQNFLVDLNIVDQIINKIKKINSSYVIEVGPGLGSLTDSIIELGRDFIVIELDCVFANYWRSRDIEVLEGDALKFNWSEIIKKNSLLVSNLPYQISSSIVIDRSIEDYGLTDMVLMFQKEVAQRITAVPKTKEYGLLTVISQVFWEVKKVCDAGPSCFYPPPKISSRVLSFKSKEIDLGFDRKKFLMFVKICFAQRRKIFWKSLKSEIEKFNKSFEEAMSMGKDIGISEKSRAEDISPEQFVKLFLSLTS